MLPVDKCAAGAALITREQIRALRGPSSLRECTAHLNATIEQKIELDERDVADLSRQNEAKLAELQNQSNAKIILRGNILRIIGEEEEVQRASEMVRAILDLTHRGRGLSAHEFKHVVRQASRSAARPAGESAPGAGNGEDRPYDKPLSEIFLDGITVPLKRRMLSPLTGGQKRYLDEIRRKDIVFGIGPAGTGKTYLAVAMAVSALMSGRVSRIILCRPAVEAGEKLGFLPGDLKEKLDPYVRPLYDALYEMMESEKVYGALETGVIEIAPLAFMRGRTLNNAFVILDEGQNTTPEQMKMFLTRLGFESKAVITGDVTQIDLPGASNSGLIHVQKVLKGIPDIGFVYFDEQDVVRHDLVMKIVKAYERYDGKAKEAASPDLFNDAPEEPAG